LLPRLEPITGCQAKRRRAPRRQFDDALRAEAGSNSPRSNSVIDNHDPSVGIKKHDVDLEPHEQRVNRITGSQPQTDPSLIGPPEHPTPEPSKEAASNANVECSKPPGDAEPYASAGGSVSRHGHHEMIDCHAFSP
jgi:hypothetical protein